MVYMAVDAFTLRIKYCGGIGRRILRVGTTRQQTGSMRRELQEPFVSAM